MHEIINWFSSWNMGGQLGLLWFFPFAGLVFWGATKLVSYAEVIIFKSKFGGAFVGGTLVAAVTSIPELIIEILQASAGHPGAGAADDIGSNAFSILLIAIASLIFMRMMFLNNLSKWTKITIGISLLISVLFTILTYFQKDLSINLGSTVIGLIPLMFFVIYLINLFLQYKFGEGDHSGDKPKRSEISLKKASLLFLMWAILLVGFSMLLNITASSMQQGFNIPSNSIGGIFLAMASSLPEVVAFFMFLRNKQVTGAIGSLIGSHVFNLGILFFGDLTYSPAATFTTGKVQGTWMLGLSTVIMLVLLLTQVFLSSKFKKTFNKYKWINAVIPGLIISTYIIVWALMLAL